jgi:hypothetical protein
MLVWVGGGVSNGLEVVLLLLPLLGFERKIGNARVSSPLPIFRVFFVGLCWHWLVVCFVLLCRQVCLWHAIVGSCWCLLAWVSLVSFSLLLCGVSSSRL